MIEVPFELEDGTTIYIEAEDASKSGGMQRVGITSPNKQQDEKAVKKFSDALQHIRPAAETLLKTFKEMETPDEISLEFGMKFNAKLGTAIFASVDSAATFKVSLKWSNPKS